MARPALLFLLLVVLPPQETLAARRVIAAGGEYRRTCLLRDSRAGYTIQFIRRRELTLFHTGTKTSTLVVSTGTTIIPDIARYTDRYNVQVTNGYHVLTIRRVTEGDSPVNTSVTEGDSAVYNCRSFNVAQNVKGLDALNEEELLVPGPFGGVFWTDQFSRLTTDHQLPDTAAVLIDRENIACAVLVSNVEPAVNITTGRYGEPGSVDITDQFEIRKSGSKNNTDLSFVNRSNFFFVKQGKFTETSLRNVYCRAYVRGKTYEKSLNIQVTSKPQNKACEPQTVAAVVGSKNVRLSCLIEAHPAPRVEWSLPGGTTVNALSNNLNYAVNNEARFDGLFTTLTITSVTAADPGRFVIEAHNEEGRGQHHLDLDLSGTSTPGGAAVTEGVGRSPAALRSSAGLTTVTMCLLVWGLQ